MVGIQGDEVPSLVGVVLYGIISIGVAHGLS